MFTDAVANALPLPTTAGPTGHPLQGATVDNPAVPEVSPAAATHEPFNL